MITIVSGVPRSGTSMMMQAIVSGGIPALQDEHQLADEFNPHGYFEYSRAMVHNLETDASWIVDADGMVVKVMAFGLQFLPIGYDYRIILMRRSLQACGESMSRKARGAEPGAFFAQHYDRRLRAALKHLSDTSHLQYIEVNFDDALADPQTQMDRVADFLNVPLDRAAMVAAVDPQIGSL